MNTFNQMSKPLAIVEDEESDAILLQLALEEGHIPNPLILMRDGQELIDYLSGQPPYCDRARFPLPGLLLIDLKMPRVDGFSVLVWLARQPELRSIPAVVFSASTCDVDMKKAMALGATDYLAKPSQFKVLVKMLRDLHARWLLTSPSDAGTADDENLPVPVLFRETVRHG
jgi:CheY-like chemotaxis protein